MDATEIPVVEILVADRIEPIHGRRVHPVACTDEVLHGARQQYAVKPKMDRNQSKKSPVFPLSETWTAKPAF